MGIFFFERREEEKRRVKRVKEVVGVFWEKKKRKGRLRGKKKVKWWQF